MKVSKTVRIWLFIGVVMLFVQVILGGITRITGSGLSITKWDIIMGSIPPLNQSDWIETFNLYKATPQYHKINGGMTMSEFKFIFFWEFIHRLWARVMGFVFLFPFIYFIIKEQLTKRLTRRLIIVFILSAITASFGWIMVASGLLDRPWVNAYKLSFHLLLAFITYSYLLWTFYLASFPVGDVIVGKRSYKLVQIFVYLLWVQIFLGGLVSGMKAGLFFNTWPLMGESYVPDVLLESKQWTIQNMTLYDQYLFAPSLIQFIHRNIAYILFTLGIIVYFKLQKVSFDYFRKVNHTFVLFILIQVVLGISILLLSKGAIPVLYGVLHQATAFLLLGTSLFIFYKVKSDG